jgi:hypothetical protein
MNDEQFDFLVKKLERSKLVSLDVSFNNITNPKNLMILFKNIQISTLILKRNQLEVAQIKEILLMAKNSMNLKVLDLSSNGYSKNHCKGCIENELFSLLQSSYSLEELYLIDAAFEFKDVDKLYKAMVRIFDPRYSSELRELHISYYCEQESRQNT